MQAGDDRHRVPPDIGFSERADCGAGQAAAPVIVHVGSQLVAGEPVDLVFFDAVVARPCRRTECCWSGRCWRTCGRSLQKSSTPMSTGSSATSGRSVRIGSGMCTRAPKFLLITRPFLPSSPMPPATPAAWGVDHAAQRRVAQFFDVAFEGFQHHVRLSFAKRDRRRRRRDGGALAACCNPTRWSPG